MIEELAKNITEKFINNNIIKPEEKEIYNYCFETTIVTVLCYSILLILSVIFKESLSTLVFLISFLVFRKTSGGYHAKNYTICASMSLFAYFFYILVIKKINILFDISFYLLVIGLLIILILSPIQDDNKPFTPKQRKRFKMISKGLAAVLIIIFFALKLCEINNLFHNKYFFSFCYGIDLVALSLLISKLKRSIKNAKNQKS